MSANKGKKEAENQIIEKINSAGSYFDRFIGNVNKKSATKQILIGATTGWATGYASCKIGKMAAFAIGGGIILIELAHEQGLIKIDWNKVTKKFDEVGDKVEEAVTGEGPRWADKADRYVDRKLTVAENILKKKEKKIKKWYHALVGDEDGVKVNDLHVFVGSFIGGVFLGMAMANA